MARCFFFFVVLLILFNNALGQDGILSPEQMKLLVPHYLKGFNQDLDVKAKVVKVGDLQYSLCEQKFSSGKQQVRILLFDFKKARIMYNQAIKTWNTFSPIVSDSLTLQVIQMTNCTGWESYHRNNNTSQVYLGICNRFFLNVTGDEVDPETLKILLASFRFDKFPN